MEKCDDAGIAEQDKVGAILDDIISDMQQVQVFQPPVEPVPASDTPPSKAQRTSSPRSTPSSSSLVSSPGFGTGKRHIAKKHHSWHRGETVLQLDRKAKIQGLGITVLNVQKAFVAQPVGQNSNLQVRAT